VAADGTGERFLVVWVDNRRYSPSSYDTDIYAQLMTADGTRIGSNFRLNVSTAETRDPAVAWNPVSGQWLVVWTTDSLHLMGQAVSTDGTRVGANFKITRAKSAKRSPDLAVDPVLGRYLVVWSDGRNDATRGWDIHGRLLRSDLSRVRRDFRISGGAALGDENLPAVAADPGGSGFLVAWSDLRTSAGVFSQRVKPSGKMPGFNVRVSGANHTLPGTPAVASQEAGKGYLVVWSEQRTSNWLTDLLGRLIAANGERKGSVFLLGGEADREDGSPDVAWDGAAARWLVVWANEDVGAGGSEPCPSCEDNRVHARVVKPTGKRGPTWQAATSHWHMAPVHPAIAWSTAGLHLLAWVDNWESGPMDIRARTIGLGQP